MVARVRGHRPLARIGAATAGSERNVKRHDRSRRRPPVKAGARVLGALLLLLALGSCSSSHHASTPTVTTVPGAPAIVPITVPGSAPLPATLHSSKQRSACSATRPASFEQTGVARLDISLVAIAPVTTEVCVYGGPSVEELRGHVAFAGAAARTVADALNGVTGIDPVSGPRCEPGPKAAVVVLISDGLRTEALAVSLTGCRGVANGLLSGAGTPSTAAVIARSVALAARCTHQFGLSDGCIAGTS